MKRIIAALLCVVMLVAFCSCSSQKSKGSSNGKKSGNRTENGTTENTGEMPDVVKGKIVFRNYGEMEFEIYPKDAPQSAYNFIHLAQSGFYDGIIVHRLIKDFVIQAGAFEPGFTERASDNKCIFGEFAQNGFNNPIKHEKGVLSWARPQALNGASTQFFICTGDDMVKSLDGGYAPFGRITSGFDVMDEINNQPTRTNMMLRMSDVPVNDIVIESVTIDTDYIFPLPDYVN